MCRMMEPNVKEGTTWKAAYRSLRFCDCFIWLKSVGSGLFTGLKKRGRTKEKDMLTLTTTTERSTVLHLRLFSVGCWWDLNLHFGLTHSETRSGSAAWTSDLPHYPESCLSCDSEANPSSWRGFQMTHSDRTQECGHEPYNSLITIHRHGGGGSHVLMTM